MMDHATPDADADVVYPAVNARGLLMEASPDAPPLAGLEPERLTRLCCDLLDECLGGKETVEMLVKHHEEGATYRQLGALCGLSAAAVLKRLDAARATLRRLGLMPAAWEPRPR